MGKKIIALDVGNKRIGVAIADSFVKLPSPLTTLDSSDALNEIVSIVYKERVSEIVVGLPRNLGGNSTEQTKLTQEFIGNLKNKVGVPVYEQDEAVTSAQAEEELKKRGKPYNKEDIDSLAATYILEDYLVNRRDDV